MSQSEKSQDFITSDRRAFLRSAGVTLAAAGSLLGLTHEAEGRSLTDEEKLGRIASNTYPMRWIFKRRANSGPTSERAETMKQKYGEITMLDFPQFTKDTFPGVRHMDLWSSLFGDINDDAMFTQQSMSAGERTRTFYEFDPATAAGKRWLEQLAGKIASTGVRCHHVSNNAPRNISDLDAEKRKVGISVAKKWLDACAQIGAKTMRVNTGGPKIVPSASATQGYPRNDEIVRYLKNAIESFKEMADYGGKVGVKVTIENHWGLSADPMNIRIILDEVNHPYCEASPDFCNWEHEYLLYHGLEALAPYTHSIVHAKYWDRWGEVDLRRCVKILTNGKFKGLFALEYEDGPWDGVEGCRYMLKEILAALQSFLPLVISPSGLELRHFMSIQPGAKLGPYEILAPLGAGGMGEVYKARDTRLERTVAIKVLPAHFSADAGRRQRFEREARTISRLNHPHILTDED